MGLAPKNILRLLFRMRVAHIDLPIFSRLAHRFNFVIVSRTNNWDSKKC
eukprot:gene4380-3185_t